jgi:hypothetical protein
MKSLITQLTSFLLGPNSPLGTLFSFCESNVKTP